jgi:hypothetical protein
VCGEGVGSWAQAGWTLRAHSIGHAQNQGDEGDDASQAHHKAQRIGRRPCERCPREVTVHGGVGGGVYAGCSSSWGLMAFEMQTESPASEWCVSEHPGIVDETRDSDPIRSAAGCGGMKRQSA